MGHYLRDQMVVNVTIKELDIRTLSAALVAALDSSPTVQSEEPILHFTIRFDEQGNQAFSLDDLLKFFNSAKAVERLVMTLETAQAVNSNRNSGTYIEVCLDRADSTRCFFRVSSDDQGWVNAHFSAIESIFFRLKNRNGIVRWQPFTVFIQASAMVIGYSLSLVAAQAIAPNLAIDNAIIFAFIFVLLVYSHLWSLVGPALSRYLNRGFPLVRFDNGKRTVADWLFQGLATSAVWGLVGYIFVKITGLILPSLTGLIK